MNDLGKIHAALQQLMLDHVSDDELGWMTWLSAIAEVHERLLEQAELHQPGARKVLLEAEEAWRTTRERVFPA